MIRLPKKYSLSLTGVLLATGAPVGWFLLDFLVGGADSLTLYAYLFCATATVFALWGFILGRYQDVLRRLVEKDDLTVLLNQETFMKRLDWARRAGHRHQDDLSVIMMDIDQFKKVNDQHSHLLGSAVLKDIGRLIRAELRETDFAARYGGDEFIIGMPRTNADQARVLAERLRRAVEEREFAYRGERVRVTLSCGVATDTCDRTGQVSDLVAAADRYLYVAKENRRNQVAGDFHQEEVLHNA